MTGNPPRRSSFGKTFFVANTMEIFERLAWYGFFAVSSLYMTSPVTQGGLGFSDQQRGLLQGLIPFLLYLLPAFTGALGDRYGYKRMFIIAFAIMSPAYFLLGQAKPFWLFTLVFITVAVGAAIFKPLVVGTVSRTTDDSNRGLGFGIFYVMVNVGGFIGPLVAGYVRAISWDWVFVMASVWIAINFIPVLFLFREPTEGHAADRSKPFSYVLKELAAVLGNFRFITFVLPILFVVMLTSLWISWTTALLFIALWSLLNIVWSKAASSTQRAHWYQQPLRVSNPPFLMYLLIVAGYWAVYNQLFITLPLYIRDYVDTSSLVQAAQLISPTITEQLSSVNHVQLTQTLMALAKNTHESISADLLQVIQLELVHQKIRVPTTDIADFIRHVQTTNVEPAYYADVAAQWAQRYRQISPEYLLSINFACILLLQLLISYVVQFRRAILVLVAGTVLAALSFAVAAGAINSSSGGVYVLLAIVLFSFGEMLTSPKSQDYIAGIMPKSQAAMYMGYYFVSMALGFLLAGISSGWAYQTFAREAGRPDWLWWCFSVVAAMTALALLWFHRYVAHKLEQSQKGSLS